MTHKPKKAVLDDRGRLIDAKPVKKLAEGDIDPGDLPLDGSYKLDRAQGAFIPVGHGFGKVGAPPPHSSDHVLALMIGQAGDDAPAAAREWLAWYDAHMRAREEEKRS